MYVHMYVKIVFFFVRGQDIDEDMVSEATKQRVRVHVHVYTTIYM